MVLVALQDPLLDETTAELSAAFPEQRMRKVSLNDLFTILNAHHSQCQVAAFMVPAFFQIACRVVRETEAPLSQVGVDLGKPGYMTEVQKQTADLDVQIVFCNAGYMLTGFFDSMWLSHRSPSATVAFLPQKVAHCAVKAVCLCDVDVHGCTMRSSRCLSSDSKLPLTG